MMQISQTAAATMHGMLPHMHPTKGKWQRINGPYCHAACTLSPSSMGMHTASVVKCSRGSRSTMRCTSGTIADADYKTVPAQPTDTNPEGAMPKKRVGHTAVVIRERIFVSGGRGGRDMTPLEEKGHIWVLDTCTEPGATSICHLACCILQRSRTMHPWQWKSHWLLPSPNCTRTL